MTTAFPRTMRALEGARMGRTGWRLAGVLAALAAWGAWMTCARVSVYASSSTARLEVTRMAHQVASSETGAVVHLELALGRTVRAGEVLVELDTRVEDRRLEEATTLATALASRISALDKQVDAERDAARAQWDLDSVAARRSRADVGSAELEAAHDEELRKVAARLHDSALASGIDRMNAEHQARKTKQAESTSRVDLQRAFAAQRYDGMRSRANLAVLQAQIADLEAQSQTARAVAETARAEIERRRIRAPIDGKLASIAVLREGDVVKAGDRVATVLPNDEVHVVAELPPEEAAGRVRERQQARVRLSGFPWTQYGMLAARVSHVAREPRDGTIRVELTLDPDQGEALPIEHGLPATVDVEVERVSPWALLLRGAGMITSAPPPPPASPPVARGPS